MWQVNIQIGGTVLGASLRADGCVSIFRLSPSGEFCDLDSKGEMWASFWQDEFMITDGSTIEELRCLLYTSDAADE